MARGCPSPAVSSALVSIVVLATARVTVSATRPQSTAHLPRAPRALAPQHDNLTYPIGEGAAVFIDKGVPAMNRDAGLLLELLVPQDGAARHCSLRAWRNQQLQSSFPMQPTVFVASLDNAVAVPTSLSPAGSLKVTLPGVVGQPSADGTLGGHVRVYVQVKPDGHDGWNRRGVAAICVRDGDLGVSDPADVLQLSPAAEPTQTVGSGDDRYIVQLPAAQGGGTTSVALLTVAQGGEGSTSAQWRGTGVGPTTRGPTTDPESRNWCVIAIEGTPPATARAYAVRVGMDNATVAALPSPTNFDVRTLEDGDPSTLVLPTGNALGMWVIAVYDAGDNGFTMGCALGPDGPEFATSFSTATGASSLRWPLAATGNPFPYGSQARYEAGSSREVRIRTRPLTMASYSRFGRYFVMLRIDDVGSALSDGTVLGSTGGVCQIHFDSPPATPPTAYVRYGSDPPIPKYGVSGESGIVDTSSISSKAGGPLDASGRVVISSDDKDEMYSNGLWVLVTGVSPTVGVTISCGPPAILGLSTLTEFQPVAVTIDAETLAAVYTYVPPQEASSDSGDRLPDPVCLLSGASTALQLSTQRGNMYAASIGSGSGASTTTFDSDAAEVGAGLRDATYDDPAYITVAAASSFATLPATATLACGRGYVRMQNFEAARSKVLSILGAIVAYCVGGVLLTYTVLLPPRDTPERLVLYRFPTVLGALGMALYVVPTVLVLLGMLLDPLKQEGSVNTVLMFVGTGVLGLFIIFGGPKSYDFDDAKGTLTSTARWFAWLPLQVRTYPLANLKKIESYYHETSSVGSDGKSSVHITEELRMMPGDKALESTGGFRQRKTHQRIAERMNNWLSARRKRIKDTNRERRGGGGGGGSSGGGELGFIELGAAQAAPRAGTASRDGGDTLSYENPLMVNSTPAADVGRTGKGGDTSKGQSGGSGGRNDGGGSSGKRRAVGSSSDAAPARNPTGGTEARRSSDLPPPTASAPLTPAAPSGGAPTAGGGGAIHPKFCPYCGAKRTAQTKFCGECGAQVLE